MNFKTIICVLTPNGYFEEDGIVVNLPIVPQQGIILRLSEDQMLLLEAKAKVSKYKNEYISHEIRVLYNKKIIITSNE